MYEFMKYHIALKRSLNDKYLHKNKIIKTNGGNKYANRNTKQ